MRDESMKEVMGECDTSLFVVISSWVNEKVIKPSIFQTLKLLVSKFVSFLHENTGFCFDRNRMSTTGKGIVSLNTCMDIFQF